MFLCAKTCCSKLRVARLVQGPKANEQSEGDLRENYIMSRYGRAWLMAEIHNTKLKPDSVVVSASAGYASST